MIRSMTGFARRERQFPWGLLAWELKTVNHRFLELGCRLPEEFRAAEADFRAAVAAAVRRGKVECSLHFRPTVVATALEVDAELLASLTLRAQQAAAQAGTAARSEEHTSELQSLAYLVCRLLLEKKKNAIARSPTKKQKNHK